MIRTERLLLRPLGDTEPKAMVSYLERNRHHFKRTDPDHPPEFFTEAFWRKRVRLARTQWKEDSAVSFILFLRENPDRVIGSASFTQIARGPFQACYLGFAIDKEFEGKGLMTEALQAAIRYMFERKNLHRIMANHLPSNRRSAALLRRLGFRREGLAKKYLRIHGRWRDHVLNSLSNPRWKAES